MLQNSRKIDPDPVASRGGAGGQQLPVQAAKGAGDGVNGRAPAHFPSPLNPVKSWNSLEQGARAQQLLLGQFVTSVGWQRGEAPVTHPGKLLRLLRRLSSELLLELSLKHSEFPGAPGVPLRCCCHAGKSHFFQKTPQKGQLSVDWLSLWMEVDLWEHPRVFPPFSLLAPIQIPKKSAGNHHFS